jgi:hypothetical protein
MRRRCPRIRDGASGGGVGGRRLSDMTTRNFELARVAWQARDHMYRAAADVRAARRTLQEAQGAMQWRSRAADRFAARADEVVACTDGVANRCDVASDTLLAIGNHLAAL